MTVIQKAFGMYRIDYLSRSQETFGVIHSITEVSVRVSPHNQDQVGIIMFRDEFPPRTNFINSNDNLFFIIILADSMTLSIFYDMKNHCIFISRLTIGAEVF